MKGRNFALKRFPSGDPGPDLNITCSVERRAGTLVISYSLSGSIEEIIIPPPAKVLSRKKSLWEETCLEFFIAAKDSDLYREFNLSPSGNWNVYHFKSYRRGMREDRAFTTLPFSVSVSPGNLRLSIRLDLRNVSLTEQVLQIAASAVIKERSGRHTYWALTHPGTQPDFHRRESFILEV